MAQQQQQTSIKLISECFVKPNYEVEDSKQPYHLSPPDICKLSINPIKKGLLVSINKPNPNPNPNPPSNNNDPTKLISHFLEKFKQSLSIALVHFNPLAGRFVTEKYPEDHSCSIYIDCNKGPGARLIHATTILHFKVSDIVSSVDIPPIVRSFFELGEKMVKVNHDGHKRALLSVQVLKLPYLDPEESITYGDPGLLRERIFHFSPTSLATLKAKANHECGPHNVVVSSFQTLSAFVWRSITLARNLSSDQLTTCSMLVGARSRFEPPLSNEYFGDILSIVPAEWTCKVEELLGRDLGWSAMNLKKAILAQDGKAILGVYQALAKSPMVFKPNAKDEFYGPNEVVFGGSVRFDMYGPEFGLGRALAVRMGYTQL